MRVNVLFAQLFILKLIMKFMIGIIEQNKYQLHFEIIQ